jgi:hypothetical protein
MRALHSRTERDAVAIGSGATELALVLLVLYESSSCCLSASTERISAASSTRRRRVDLNTSIQASRSATCAAAQRGEHVAAHRHQLELARLRSAPALKCTPARRSTVRVSRCSTHRLAC